MAGKSEADGMQEDEFYERKLILGTGCMKWVSDNAWYILALEAVLKKREEESVPCGTLFFGDCVDYEK